MTERDKDVILARQKIRPGKADVLRDWFEERLDETAAEVALRKRGIRVESAFVHATEDEDYLMYFAEAYDFDEAMSRFDASDRDVDCEYREIVEETLVGGFDALHGTRGELLFHIVVQSDRR